MWDCVKILERRWQAVTMVDLAKQMVFCVTSFFVWNGLRKQEQEDHHQQGSSTDQVAQGHAAPVLSAFRLQRISFHLGGKNLLLHFFCWKDSNNKKKPPRLFCIVLNFKLSKSNFVIFPTLCSKSGIGVRRKLAAIVNGCWCFMQR